MSHEDIIRAWKDEDYRNSLSEEQRAQLPENPAGMVELSDEAMQNVAGGLFTIFGCNGGGGNTSNPLPLIGCLKTQGLTCSTINIGDNNLCG